MTVYNVENHADSLLPDGKNWMLVWSDEFDGTEIDKNKWSFRYHIMGVEHGSWSGEAARLDGKGNLVFSVVKKGSDYLSSQLQTGENYMDRPGKKFARYTWPIAAISQPKFMRKFGYFECRCKLQQKPGWWSAFWMQSPIQGSTLDPSFSGVEIDIMESFSPNVISHNIHWNGCGADLVSKGSGKKTVEPTSDGYHLFGMEWSRRGYSFYVDGKLSWHIDGPVSEREQFILISTECNGYREEPICPEKAKESLGDSFTVDYIRVYDSKEL